MYKCFKKVDNNWIQADDLETYYNQLRTEDYSTYRCEEKTTQKAYEMGYCKVEHKIGGYWDKNYYKKDDCGVVTVERSTQKRYFKDYTTSELQTLDNDTLKRYGVVRCEHCNKFYSTDWISPIRVGRNHYYCSEDCAKHYATRCSVCGKWYSKASSFTNERVLNMHYTMSDDGTEHNNENYHCCNHCYNSYVSHGYIQTCADCGVTVYRPQRIRVHGQYNYYCSRCATNYVIPRVIRGYHAQHSDGWCFQHGLYETEDKTTLHLGVELECEVKDYDTDPNDIAYEIHKLVNTTQKLFEFETDGSLHNGYETISQPCTIMWWHEHQDLVKQMLEKMSSLGCISHNSPRCGLHIHIGRNFFTDYEYETRFVELFYHLKDDLMKFCRRNPNQMGYCAFNRYYDKHNAFTCKNDMKGHGTALNLQNEHTVEVRIFKGTLDFASFMSCIELCYNLACYVRDFPNVRIADGSMEHVSFQDIIDYKPTFFLNAYWQERQHKLEMKGAE